MNRRALIIGVVGAAVLTLLWFFLLWSPQGKRLDAAEQREEAAKQANSQLEVELDRLEDLESRRPELETQLAELRRAVPDQPQLARFFLAAHDAATQSGVELNTVTPTKPAADAAAAATTTTAAPAAGGSTTTTTAAAGTTATVVETTAAPSAINLSMEVKGGYFQVLDFMNRIDDLQRIVVVDSLDLGGGEEEGQASGTNPATSSNDLTASITARMFTGAAPAGDGTTAGGATTATTAATTATTATGTDS